MRSLAISLLFVTAGSGPALAEDPVVATVKAVDADWSRAYLACDAEAWDALLVDELTYLHNNGRMDDKAGQMTILRRCNMGSLKSEVASVRLYGDDTEIVLGRLTGETKGGFPFDLFYTRVYVLENSAWRLVAHQSTDVPKESGR